MSEPSRCASVCSPKLKLEILLAETSVKLNARLKRNEKFKNMAGWEKQSPDVAVDAVL